MSTNLPTPNWEDFAKDLPGDLPDTAYDALRQQFFQSKVRPLLMGTGESPTVLFNEWWKKTERPDKAQFPRLKVAATSALEALTSPILGLGREGSTPTIPEKWSQEALQEAQRQGVNPTLPAFAGAAVGMAPYFAPLGAAGGVAEALGVPRAMVSIPGMGVLQGAYDAAKAESGKRLEEGAQGLVIGTGLAAGFEALPLLTKLRKTGLSTEQAQAVEASTKGVANAEQQVVAQTATQVVPDVTRIVAEHLEQLKGAAGKVGINDAQIITSPRMPVEIGYVNEKRMSGRLQTGLVGTDNETRLAQTAKTLKGLMDKGLPISEIRGDSATINALLQAMGEDTTVTLPAAPRGVAGTEPPPSTRTIEVPGGVEGKKIETPKTLQDQLKKVVEEQPEVVAPPTIKSDTDRAIERLTTELEDPNLHPIQRQQKERVLERMKAAKERIAASEAFTAPEEPTSLETSSLEASPAQAIEAAVAGKTKPPALSIQDIPLTDRVELLPNGQARDAVTGQVYETEDALLQDVVGMRERPLAFRAYTPGLSVSQQARGLGYPGAEAIPEEATAAVYRGEPGTKPDELYTTPNKPDQWHESIHSFLGYFGLVPHLEDLVRSTDRRMFALLPNVFDSQTREVYDHILGEELFTHLGTAVRTGDTDKVALFAMADEGESHLFNWYGKVLDDVVDKISEQPSSVYKTAAMRRFTDLQRRVTREVETVSRPAEVFGDRVALMDGKYTLFDREGKQIRKFDTRQDLLDNMTRYEEPLQAPDLVDESVLPEGIPRFALAMRGEAAPPRRSLPAPIGGQYSGKEPVAPSYLNLTRYFTPFYDWVSQLASKAQWPELYDKFRAIGEAQIGLEQSLSKYEGKLKSTLGQIPHDRQGALLNWMVEKDNPAYGPERKTWLENELGVTAKEKAAVTKFEIDVLDAARGEFSDVGSLQAFLQTRFKNAQRQLALGKRVDEFVSKDAKKRDFWDDLLYTGQVDPLHDNLMDVAHTYLRKVSYRSVMEDAIEDAQKLIDSRTADGKRVLGNYYAGLDRHLGFMRGEPDMGGRVIDGMMQSAVDGYNNVVDKLPEGIAERLHFNGTARDAFGRFMLYQYAGGLGFRAMVPIRDSLQLFLTTLPILGPKYTVKGIVEAFGENKNAWNLAEEYGVMMHKRDFANLYAPGMGNLKPNLADKVAENSLKLLQISNNSNRLVAWLGHSERAYDAIVENSGRGPSKFVKESGINWLDKNLQAKYVKEIFGGQATEAASPTQWLDISRRIGKDLTDVSQWNYRRGALPGMYEYSLGRLFGQYGTWPLNYVNYALKLVANAKDDPGAIARLALAHYAVQKAGQGFGINTDQWVFTQPMAWQGGPLGQAAMNAITGVSDWETYVGDQSRRQLLHTVWPSAIPGGLEGKNIYHAVTDQKQDFWKLVLGFQPLTPKMEKTGWSGVTP